MDLSSLSANLRRLRAAADKSQAEIAASAGLSRVGYRRVEAGEVAPRVDTLMAVANALDASLEDLLTPVPRLERVRFRAQKKMTSREDLLARVGKQLEDYAELEDLLKVKPTWALKGLPAELKRSSDPSPERAAARARKGLHLEEGEPIRDICGLFEARGIRVLTPKLASEGFFGLSVAGDSLGPAIVVNTWERISVERWIFTAAHELGHLLLHVDAYDVARADEEEQQESQADLFASHFLMPEHVFQRELEQTRGHSLVDRVLKLKAIFHVSYATVLYRISSALKKQQRSDLWKQFYVAYKRRTGKSLERRKEPASLSSEAFFGGRPATLSADEPEHLPESTFKQDRLFYLVRQAVEKRVITLSRAAQILQITVSEMRELSASWMG